jgi:segregation and condensation protein B
MSENNVKAVIEALLFSSDKPLTLEQIKEVLDGYSTNEIRRLLLELKSEYETSGRGIEIIEVAGGFQMVTPKTLATFLKKLFKPPRVERLSRPALETIAIIAYKQPVTKREIESLRGVNTDAVVENLLDKELIRISGRRKTPGRPHIFCTTRRFLEYFGLKSLDELPKVEDFLKLKPQDQQEESLESPAAKMQDEVEHSQVKINPISP